jgi:hypothetical protein
MMAPTVQAKQRWVQALQYATNRRIFIQRRPSSAIVGNSLLLAMEAPQNLSIYCTQILRGEWLLIGAQEGLFATSMQQQQLRAPFQIAGVSKVFWMELLPEFDMLLIICGSIRRLMVVHLHQLNRAFKAEQQPSINLTSVSNIEQCHIAVISKPEHNREKRQTFFDEKFDFQKLLFKLRLSGHRRLDHHSPVHHKVGRVLAGQAVQDGGAVHVHLLDANWLHLRRRQLPLCQIRQRLLLHLTVDGRKLSVRHPGGHGGNRGQRIFAGLSQ